ncbi:unnamed protein product [marine sediment metagenome]|uniref:Uncharacterized protein n=1 Tax=marine sediment metagenome TaxID=412755 RepID=X0T4E6_9ZZZZ
MPESQKRYFELYKLYVKWNKGLFGSRKFHEGFLKKYLIKMLGKEIQTDFDFIVKAPDGVFDNTVICKGRFGKWLHIKGKLDPKTLKEVGKKHKGIYKKWWRTNILIAISGRVRKFRLDWDKYGDIIVLYLDSIKLILE